MFQENAPTLVLPESIERLVAKLSPKKSCTPSELAEIVLASNIQTQELMEFANFDHSADDSYGKTILHKGSNFEVALLSWAPGDFSCIHNHGISEWGIVKAFGELEHRTFQLHRNFMRTKSIVRFHSGVISTIDESLIHQIGNPTDRQIISLHVYGLNQFATSVRQDSQLYDLTSGMVLKTDDGAFYEADLGAVSMTNELVYGDYPTWLNNLVRQIDRIKAMGEFSRLKDLLYSLRSTDHCDRLNDYFKGKLDEKGRFLSKNEEKIFGTAILGLGRLIKEYPEYDRKMSLFVQLDRSKSVFIIQINQRQLLLDYSHDKLVIS